MFFWISPKQHYEMNVDPLSFLAQKKNTFISIGSHFSFKTRMFLFYEIFKMELLHCFIVYTHTYIYVFKIFGTIDLTCFRLLKSLWSLF